MKYREGTWSNLILVSQKSDKVMVLESRQSYESPPQSDMVNFSDLSVLRSDAIHTFECRFGLCRQKIHCGCALQQRCLNTTILLLGRVLLPTKRLHSHGGCVGFFR
jgi:hypothetical protein